MNSKDNQQPVDELQKILKDFLDDVDYVLEAPLEHLDTPDRFDRPYIQAKARLLQWGTEQYKKGYIDGGIGVINEQN